MNFKGISLFSLIINWKVDVEDLLLFFCYSVLLINNATKLSGF